MNALHILSVYQWLLENPNADYTPHIRSSAQKAAPGYYFAKEILQFIVCLADTINNDPRVNQKLRVIFVENYCVSWAELLTRRRRSANRSPLRVQRLPAPPT